MKGPASIFMIIFFIIGLGILGIATILNYNGLIKAEKSVEEAQAQIETLCQRRLDLIPNMIETVKGYTQHEQQTLLAITQARTEAKNVLDDIKSQQGLSEEEMMKLQVSQSELGKALKVIFALAENYPNLKASTNFLALQDQWEGSENRIAVARQRYNTAVRIYNAKTETFPGIILAPIFGFSEKPFFEAKTAAMEPVKAQF
jgi:LemA protein